LSHLELEMNLQHRIHHNLQILVLTVHPRFNRGHSSLGHYNGNLLTGRQINPLHTQLVLHIPNSTLLNILFRATQLRPEALSPALMAHPHRILMCPHPHTASWSLHRMPLEDLPPMPRCLSMLLPMLLGSNSVHLLLGPL
jgi:hypothetical protein